MRIKRVEPPEPEPEPVDPHVELIETLSTVIGMQRTTNDLLMKVSKDTSRMANISHCIGLITIMVLIRFMAWVLFG